MRRLKEERARRGDDDAPRGKWKRRLAARADVVSSLYLDAEQLGLADWDINDDLKHLTKAVRPRAHNTTTSHTHAAVCARAQAQHPPARH